MPKIFMTNLQAQNILPCIKIHNSNQIKLKDILRQAMYCGNTSEQLLSHWLKAVVT